MNKEGGQLLLEDVGNALMCSVPMIMSHYLDGFQMLKIIEENKTQRNCFKVRITENLYRDHRAKKNDNDIRIS